MQTNFLYQAELKINYYLRILCCRFDEGSGGIVVKVSAFQPRDNGFEPYSGYDRASLYVTSIGLFQEADSKVI
jgi:hypothetical protein